MPENAQNIDKPSPFEGLSLDLPKPTSASGDEDARAALGADTTSGSAPDEWGSFLSKVESFKLPALEGLKAPVPGPDHDSLKAQIWATVESLMDEKYGRQDLRRLADDSGIGYPTASRLKSSGNALSIEVVEKVAKAFGLTPAQLLEPSTNRYSAVNQHTDARAAKDAGVSEQALQLDRLLQDISDPERQRWAYDTCVQVLKLSKIPG